MSLPDMPVCVCVSESESEIEIERAREWVVVVGGGDRL